MVNAVLKVLGGKQDGKLIPLTTKKFLIGREQDCHLRPNSDSVSRHHCVISIDDFTVQVRDLGSSNGTFLNNIRIIGVREAKTGDRLRIGTLEFEIVFSKKPSAVAAGVEAGPSSGTSFSIADFGLEEANPVAETAVMSGGDTVVVNPKKDDQPAVPESIPDTTDLPLQPAAVEDELEPAPPAPLETLVAQSTPAAEPFPAQPAVPPTGYPYAQPQMPGAYPGYGMPMPQMGYPYGMPQQPYPYMPPQPGFMPPYGMPYPQPYQQPGYGYPQAVPQPTQPEPVEAPVKTVDALPVNLPPPEQTGVKEAPKTEATADQTAPKPPAPNPAADILKKYMTRRS